MADIFKVWMFNDPSTVLTEDDISQLLIGMSIDGFGSKWVGQQAGATTWVADTEATTTWKAQGGSD